MTQAHASDLLKQGILAKKAGDKSTARLLFSRALQIDPQNENGWLWLASVAESPQQARAMVARVLQINPQNKKALRLRRKLNPAPQTAPPKPQATPPKPAPAVNPKPELVQRPPRKQVVPTKAPSRGRVLVVDDSLTVRSLVSMTLQRHGYQVDQAADGMEAISKLNETLPDLILLDVNMPRMDGYQVCRTIRSSKETGHIPIIMLSGKDGFFDRVKGRIAGATEYITKPFAPRELIMSVEKRIVQK